MADQTDQSHADQIMQAEILDRCERLASLLREPQPGLLTWQSFRAENAAALYNALARVVDIGLVNEEAHTAVGVELATRREHAGGQVVSE